MIRKLAPYTKGYRVYILLGILCSAGEAVLELMLPKAMSNIVDYGIGGNGGAGDRSYILTMGLKMVLMALICLALGVGAAALAAKAGMGFGANVRDAEYRQVQRFSFSNIEHFSTASLITRLTNDVSSVQMTLMRGMRMLVRAPVMLITAPNIICGFMAGSVICHSSCQRLRMPSTAPASYSRLSTFWNPAMKDRKLVPRLVHRMTATAAPNMTFESVSHCTGS